MKKYAFPLVLWLLFETIAIILWLTLDNRFYLYNFTYIGSCLALGSAFYMKKMKWARNMVRIRLLDSYDIGFTSIQGAAAAAQKNQLY